MFNRNINSVAIFTRLLLPAHCKFGSAVVDTCYIDIISVSIFHASGSSGSYCMENESIFYLYSSVT
jgi:hypothetical protein